MVSASIRSAGSDLTRMLNMVTVLAGILEVKELPQDAQSLPTPVCFDKNQRIPRKAAGLPAKQNVFCGLLGPA